MRYRIYFLVLVCFSVWCSSVIISPNSAKAQKRYEIPCSLILWNASFDSIKTQLGVCELTGNNDGYEVQNYLWTVGLWKGLPYCEAGQYWGFYVAADSCKSCVPLLNTGLASAAFNDAIRKGTNVPAIPQIKDLIYWKFSKTPNGHVGRIDSIGRAGWVTTVEFNSPPGSTGNQRDGNVKKVSMVNKKKRNIRFPLGKMQLRGFIGRKK